MTLVLSVAVSADDGLLKLLESRRGERDAQAFVKTRRRREKQSLEGVVQQQQS